MLRPTTGWHHKRGARRCQDSNIALLAEWAFASGLERLFLLIHLDNENSNRLAERCGSHVKASFVPTSRSRAAAQTSSAGRF